MISNIINDIENYINSLDEIPGNIMFYNEIPGVESEFKTELIEVKEEKIEYKAEIKEQIENKILIEEKTIIKNIEKPVYTNQDWKSCQDIPELKNSINQCTNCSLGFTRKNFVFGSGNPNADIMIIGEAPGADEDEQGLPFVGRAGQLLTKIIEAINLTRDEVFICNILKCRPPENRKPLVPEVDECEPYLKKQIELIKPKFLLLLGITAAETLLKTPIKMGTMRGNLMKYEGIDTLITYHPAALLRNPNWKPLVWEDVKLLRKLYDEYLNKKEKN